MPATADIACRGCGCRGLTIDADFGLVAASNALLETADAPVARLPFRLAGCPACELIQLVDLPPLEVLRAPEHWIRFRDPERHLPDLALAVSEFLPRRDGLIVGVTYKDEPLLNELSRLGFDHTHVLDRERDWGLTDERQGIETVQQRFTPEWSNSWTARFGALPSLLVVRHVLEHAHDLGSFLEACRTLVAEDGFVLLEVPGCEQEFHRGDAGALWEEHVSYFTSTSLRATLQRHGLHCELIGNYPYAVEDCLFALARPVTHAPGNPPPLAPGASSGRLLAGTFHEAVVRQRATFQATSDNLRQLGRRIALLGAGHRTTTAADVLQLGGIVDCVIDDDPSKQDRFLPGTGLPILPAAALVPRDIGLCVSMLNPDVTRRIETRERAYAEKGGRFAFAAALRHQ